MDVRFTGRLGDWAGESDVGADKFRSLRTRPRSGSADVSSDGDAISSSADAPIAGFVTDGADSCEQL